MSGRCYLGIDLGTTSFKGVVLDLDRQSGDVHATYDRAADIHVNLLALLLHRERQRLGRLRLGYGDVHVPPRIFTGRGTKKLCFAAVQ